MTANAAATVAGERDSNAIIEQQLDDRLMVIETAADADVLAYIGPIAPPADDLIKDAVEEIDPHRAYLMVVIETPGGYIDTAERIARILRHQYGRVDFVVPSYAM